MISPASPISPLVQSPVYFEDIVLPNSFSLICWNVHKENLQPGFISLLKALEVEYALEIILLQEALFSSQLISIAGFPYVAAANLHVSGMYSGVVTAAHADPTERHHYMTLAREPFVFTPKSTLVTIYRFQRRPSLAVVNLHAINFRSLSWYKWEMSRLYELLKGHSGPMVLAGDFNCWQSARKQVLDHLREKLALEYVVTDNSHRGKKLLWIFTRSYICEGG